MKIGAMAMGTFYAIFDKETFNPPKETDPWKDKKSIQQKFCRFSWTYELKAWKVVYWPVSCHSTMQG